MSKPDKTLPRRTPTAGAIAISALALTLAACSGSSTPKAAISSPALTGRMLGATFSGTIYVSTARSHFTRAFTDRVTHVASCAAAAKTGDANGTFRVPSPAAPGPQVNIQVSAFHGPGTYTPRMMQHDRADSILLTGKAGSGQYVITSAMASATPGKEVLFLQKDGSGQLVYSGAHLDGHASTPAVAGLIQWSCKS